MKLQLNRGQHGIIIGRTGCGKSVLANNLIPATGKVCIVDPKRMFTCSYNLPIYTTASSILLMKPKRFIYRPNPNELDNLNAYNSVYKYCYESKNFFVYTDEVVAVINTIRTFPKYLRICYQMGRQVGMSMLSTSQRPCDIPKWLITEVEKMYIFSLTAESDIKRIKEGMADYNPNKLKSKHEFLFNDIYSDNPSIRTIINVVRKEVN
jgi:energy-coupling factor transporter ATP-binding protein EcfA2